MAIVGALVLWVTTIVYFGVFREQWNDIIYLSIIQVIVLGAIWWLHRRYLKNTGDSTAE